MLDNPVPVRSRRSPARRPRPRPGRTPGAGRPSALRRYSTVLAAAAASTLLFTAIWLSGRFHPSPALHEMALFVHLGSLILGLGAVLVADYFFALWVLGRTTFAEAVTSASRLHLLVWSGLTGLIASGTLLEPDLSSGTTILKLGFVAALTLNGVQAMVLSRRMGTIVGPLPFRLLAWGGLTTAISQTCWWGAVVIGFLTANR